MVFQILLEINFTEEGVQLFPKVPLPSTPSTKQPHGFHHFSEFPLVWKIIIICSNDNYNMYFDCSSVSASIRPKPVILLGIPTLPHPQLHCIPVGEDESSWEYCCGRLKELILFLIETFLFS